MSTLSFDRQDKDHLVPAVVSEKISDVVHRTRGTRQLSAAVISLSGALVIMLTALAVDWLVVPFDSDVRTRVTLGALAAMGVLAAISFGLVAFRRVSTLDAAQRIDEQVPQLQERWMSLTQFSSTNASPEVRGSETFIRKVAEESAQLEHTVQPKSIRVGRDLTFAICGLAAVVGVWSLAIWSDPGQMNVLVRRFISPQSDISLTQIQATSGNIVLPRGSSLKLEASTSGRVRQTAEITLQKEGSADEIIRLDALKGKQAGFVYAVKDLQVPFSYRFRSGDGQTAWHSVRIADRPNLKRVDFRIVPPEYANLPEFHQAGLPKSIKALQGSRLLIEIEPSIPLTSLVLQGENKVDYPLDSSASGVYRWETQLSDSVCFRPILISTDGLMNAQPPRCEIVVFRDQAPVVEVVNPTNEVAVRPDDNVTIVFDAKDDLGISKAELVIFDESKDGTEELKTIPIPLGDQTGATSVHAETELNLKDFNLKSGEQLTYAIRVYDTKDETATNQPGSGKTAPQKDSKEQQELAANSKENANREQSDPNSKQDDAQNQDGQNQTGNPNQQASSQNQNGQNAQAQNQQGQQNQQAQNQQDSQDRDQQQANDQNEQNRKDPKEQKEQLAGGNTWSPKQAGSPKEQDDNEGPEVSGKPRPDFFMAKHELDTPAGQCTSCSRRKITIDEWAGSYASQVLEKLQLQIDPVLNALKKDLTQAKDTLSPLAKQAKPAAKWKTDDSLTVRKGDEFLSTAEGRVKELTAKSDGTPYAFIGLQLQDIAHLHVAPARERLHDVTLLDSPAKADDLSASVVHIQRAIELLEKLTRQYEAVKLNQKLADTMINIKKMHQMFLEGTFAMLKADKPLLNPKERAFMELELTDEFLRKLRELLQKKLEIQAELAKVLSQDPRMLERFMARSRKEATTLRDQLTLINRRQQELLDDIKTGLPDQNDPNGKLKLPNRVAKRAESAAQIAEETSQMFDNFIVWTPLKQDVNKGELAKVKAKGTQLVASAAEFAREAAGPADSNATAASEALYKKLVEWEDTLPDLLVDSDDDKMQTHVANRVEEARKLITDVTGWGLKERAIDTDRHHLAAEVDQHRITADTMILTRKLTSLRAQCQGISNELATAANDFLKTMEDDLVPELEAAQMTLDENELRPAIKHQTTCVELFTKAEKQLDDVMDGVIKHLDSLPFDAKPELSDDVQPQSLDELLAMLEDEARSAEALGIPCCRPSNLLLEKDWTKPESMPGSGGGGGGGRSSGRASLQPNAQMKQAQMAGKKADQFRKMMEDSVKKLKNQGREKQDVASQKNERKWNTLGSKLEDHLRQGRGNLPPEQYRKAIEQYFESLAGKNQAGPKGD